MNGLEGIEAANRRAVDKANREKERSNTVHAYKHTYEGVTDFDVAVFDEECNKWVVFSFECAADRDIFHTLAKRATVITMHGIGHLLTGGA